VFLSLLLLPGPTGTVVEGPVGLFLAEILTEVFGVLPIIYSASARLNEGRRSV
jgi:hypothetical protein